MLILFIIKKYIFCSLIHSTYKEKKRKKVKKIRKKHIFYTHTNSNTNTTTAFIVILLMELNQKTEAYRIEALLSSVQRNCYNHCVPPPTTLEIAKRTFGLITDDDHLSKFSRGGSSNSNSGVEPSFIHLTDEEGRCLEKCSNAFIETHKIIQKVTSKLQAKWIFYILYIFISHSTTTTKKENHNHAIC